MDPLISVTDLARELGQVTLLDVRYRMGQATPGSADYDRGHLPGAVYVDLDSQLAASPGGSQGRHPLPAPEDFQEAMRTAGVRQDRPVVVYDDWQGRAAARCWWLLRWSGKADVRVLDGGWSAWLAADLKVSQEIPAVTPGDLVVRPGSMPVLPRDEVTDFGGVLVDARAPERFRGEVEPVDPVAGHIPGAVNLPTEANLDRAGLFLPSPDLGARYARVGAGRDVEVAVYCGSGVTACHDILALARAGVPARLYPGSWSEWVATGGAVETTEDRA